MVRLITFTDDRMSISARECVNSAIKMGADDVRIYTLNDIDQDFKTKMAEVLACERGAGFYCWKPYVVHHAIQDMSSQDILIWSDAGTTWLQPLAILTDLLKGSDNLFFSNGWPHVNWCKMDLIKRVFPDYGVNSPEGHHMSAIINACKQVQASQFLMTGRSRMKQFAQDWLDIAMEPGMIDNNPSVLPNVEGFSEHRWDQSILCCLQILYGFKLHWFPSTYGFHIKDQHPGDQYPAMFLHHRKRNNEW